MAELHSATPLCTKHLGGRGGWLHTARHHKNTCGVSVSLHIKAHSRACAHFPPEPRPPADPPPAWARSFKNARRRAPSTGGGFIGGLNARVLLVS